ncbi:MAG: ABC transporter permease [Bdellovibrionales bacterium]|nr:ABC transporter permease [Bdellovibrionales bacterium]
MTYLFQNQIQLIKTMVTFKLEAESKRTYAGYFWWLFEPLMNVFIYYLLFKVFFKRGGDDYIQFLFLGLIIWKWFSDCLMKTSDCIKSQKVLISKIYIPKYVFPSVEVFYATFKFLIIFLITCMVLSFIGYPFHLRYLLLPFILFTVLILTLGLSFIFAALTPLFPDVKFLLGHFLRLAFYPSGILFSIENIPEKYHFLVKYNPVAQLISFVRDIILYRTVPDLNSWAVVFIFSSMLLGLGLILLKRFDRVYARVI